MARRAKGRASVTISVDSDGRTFKKDLGWEDNGKGGIRQPRFWLGTDQAEATARYLNLEKVWQKVCERWERDKETERPLWDQSTKAVAQAIAKGAEDCPLETPETIYVHYLNPACNTRLPKSMFEARDLVRWLREMQADFPMIRLELVDAKAQARGESYWEFFKGGTIPLMHMIHESSRPESKGGQKLHEALDAFAAHVRATKLNDGKPTPHAGGVCRQLRTLKEHQADMPLASFDMAAIERMLAHWQGLPTVKIGRTGRTKRCSHETASNHIKRIRAFVRWLHRSKDWSWRKPEDYEVLPARIASDHSQDDSSLQSEQVETYSIQELAKLWEYSTPLDRLYLVLGLNCGFGAAEVASLKETQINLDIEHPFYKIRSSFIARKRTKTGVYGEWQLWPVTVIAIRWYQSVRPASPLSDFILSKTGRPLDDATEGGNRNQAIPNAWDRVRKRILKDFSEFPKKSFNKVRKTAINAIREIAGGEIAGVFAAHGRPVGSDDLIDRYSNRPFLKVFKAIRAWGEKIAPVFATVVEPFPPGARKSNPSLSLGTIKAIHELREQGMKLREISERLGVCIATVQFYLGKAKEAEAEGPEED